MGQTDFEYKTLLNVRAILNLWREQRTEERWHICGSRLLRSEILQEGLLQSPKGSWLGAGTAVHNVWVGASHLTEQPSPWKVISLNLHPPDFPRHRCELAGNILNDYTTPEPFYQPVGKKCVCVHSCAFIVCFLHVCVCVLLLAGRWSGWYSRAETVLKTWVSLALFSIAPQWVALISIQHA